MRGEINVNHKQSTTPPPQKKPLGKNNQQFN